MFYQCMFFFFTNVWNNTLCTFKADVANLFTFSAAHLLLPLSVYLWNINIFTLQLTGSWINIFYIFRIKFPVSLLNCFFILKRPLLFIIGAFTYSS